MAGNGTYQTYRFGSIERVRWIRPSPDGGGFRSDLEIGESIVCSFGSDEGWMVFVPDFGITVQGADERDACAKACKEIERRMSAERYPDPTAPENMSDANLMRHWCDALAELRNRLDRVPPTVLSVDSTFDEPLERAAMLLVEVERRKVRPRMAHLVAP